MDSAFVVTLKLLNASIFDMASEANLKLYIAMRVEIELKT